MPFFPGSGSARPARRRGPAVVPSVMFVLKERQFNMRPINPTAPHRTREVLPAPQLLPGGAPLQDPIGRRPGSGTGVPLPADGCSWLPSSPTMSPSPCCTPLCQQRAGMMLITRAWDALHRRQLVRFPFNFQSSTVTAAVDWLCCQGPAIQMLSLPGFPAKCRRETPLNLSRRLTQTESPPPIRGRPNLEKVLAGLENVQGLCVSDSWSLNSDLAGNGLLIYYAVASWEAEI
ncbi:uncharacterized protein B0T15DRAFT_223680 [Chaetomium strumarium]|uniref:Uncharacterized protein n=1 Tax=Chaetomium strumarium TaxID=1170767 RepID=A0AAJ0GPV2_9PEZI|nr:hypothetical protein B0T15DRAFT_223680 [Chaetomium strumarium]